MACWFFKLYFSYQRSLSYLLMAVTKCGAFLCKCFTKLLYSTAPTDFVRDIWILIFLCEFLVLLKGVTKFFKDFTGEEPPFHLWFPRLFLFCWLVARAF